MPSVKLGCGVPSVKCRAWSEGCKVWSAKLRSAECRVLSAKCGWGVHRIPMFMLPTVTPAGLSPRPNCL